jgi:uncharacterized SAM-binding protein YcdF (DUF218 family)
MKYLILPAVAVLLGAVLFFFKEPIALAVGGFLMIQDDLQPADVIHVIAGGDDRTDHAIQLYKQGYGKQIFFTGGWCTQHGYYHGEHGAERAMAQGVEPEGIAFDDSRVISTYDEVVLLKEFIAKSPAPIRSVITVSDAFHGRRAVLTDRLVFGDAVTVQFSPVPFEASTYTRRWWTDPVSRQYVRDEYIKLLYYLARYRLSWGPIRQWLASLDRN